MNKKVMLEHFDSINTCGLNKDDVYNLCIEGEKSRNFDFNIDGYTVGLSSGTTGQRGLFFVSPKNSLKHAAFVMSKYINLLNKNKIAYFQRANSNLYETGTSRRLQLCFFDLIFPTENHIEELNKLKPNILIAPSRVLKQLALLKKNGLLKINPKKVINIMEVLDPNDKKIIMENFSVKFIDQFYMATEGIIGLTCKNGNIHLCEELMAIDYEFEDKATGRISFKLTDLYRYEQPHINYKMTDILELSKEACSCGNPALSIKAIHGRREDSLNFKNAEGNNVEIYPDFIARTILFSNEDIEDYQVIQQSEDTLELYISPNHQKIKDDITLNLKSLLKEKNNIDEVKINFIAKPLIKKGGKFRRIYSVINS